MFNDVPIDADGDVCGLVLAGVYEVLEELHVALELCLEQDDEGGLLALAAEPTNTGFSRKSEVRIWQARCIRKTIVGRTSTK